MKGGAYVVEGQTLINFLDKATEIKVLTDHSLSCLTLKITGPENIYKSKRFEGGDDKDIRTILVKLMPKQSPKGPVRASIKKNKRGVDDVAYGGIMTVVDEYEFNEEIQTSINVYFSTLIGDTENYQEPVCPAILESFLSSSVIVNKLGELKLEERDGIERKKLDGTEEITDKDIFTNILNTDPAIIVMEFLEDYTTLDQYEKEYYTEKNLEEEIKKLNIDLAVVEHRILDINRLIEMRSEGQEILEKKKKKS